MFYCGEDALTSAILRRLLKDICGVEDAVEIAEGIGGKSQIYSRILKLNELGRREFVIVLVDLDAEDCEPSEKQRMLTASGVDLALSDFFLFNVAKREGESWLLADVENIAHFLSVSTSLIDPNSEDNTFDPKSYLLSIASRSRDRDLKKGFLPMDSSSAKVGLSYNSLLVEFVENRWDHSNAEGRSKSLRRMRKKLAAL